MSWNKRGIHFSIIILGVALLIMPFQNCQRMGAVGNSAKTKGYKLESGSGNGTTYEGKLEIAAPSSIRPGEEVEIEVRGGTPPYNLDSNKASGTFKKIDENHYKYIFDEDSTGNLFISAEDAEGQVAVAEVLILGRNRWFFKDITSLAALPSHSVAFVQQGGKKLTVLDEIGDEIIDDEIQSLLGMESVDEISMFNKGSGLALLSVKSHTIATLDLNTREVRKVTIPNVGCSSTTKMSAYDELSVIFSCDGQQILNHLNLQTGEISSIEISVPMVSFDVVGGNLAILDPVGVINILDLKGSLLRSFPLLGESKEELIRQELGRISVLPDGSFVIGYLMSRNLAVYRANGEKMASFGGRGPKAGQFSTLGRVSSDDLGRIYVSDSGRSLINVYDSNFKFSHTLGANAYAVGSFMYPSRLEFDSYDKLYVLDAGNQRMQIFDNLGSLSGIVNYVGGSNEVNWSKPLGFSVNSDGKLSIANTSGHTVGIFDVVTKESYHLGTIRVASEEYGQFDSPESCVLTDDGLLLVADTANNRLQLFKNNQHIKTHALSTFGAPGAMNTPVDVEFNPIDRQFYVLQKGNGLIQVFSEDLVFVRDFSSQVYRSPDFSIDSNGLVYVLDKFQNQFLILDKYGRLLQTVGPELPADLKFQEPSGIAVNSRGEVAIADTENHRIQILPAYLGSENE